MRERAKDLTALTTLAGERVSEFGTALLESKATPVFGMWFVGLLSGIIIGKELI